MQTDTERRTAVTEIHAQAQIDHLCYQAMRDTLSDQARRAYVQAWDKFCEGVGPSRSMPTTPETVANYLSLLAEDGKSIATIRLGPQLQSPPPTAPPPWTIPAPARL